MKSCAPLFLLAAAALCAAAGAAHAQGRPLDDAELSSTWGQALIDLTNTSQGGYDFSRLTLNADISLSSTLRGLKLGTTASGTDIDISQLSFGRSDATETQRTVAITDPYFEWVYTGDAAHRQVVGMRLGFGSINGDVGLQMNTLSGALALTMPDGNTAALNGQRQTQIGGVALSQLGGVNAANSNDFFLSILKSAVAWPTTGGNAAAPATAQPGFWLNWTNGLKALNTAGIVPPNIPKTGP